MCPRCSRLRHVPAVPPAPSPPPLLPSARSLLRPECREGAAPHLLRSCPPSPVAQGPGVRAIPGVLRPGEVGLSRAAWGPEAGSAARGARECRSQFSHRDGLESRSCHLLAARPWQTLSKLGPSQGCDVWWPWPGAPPRAARCPPPLPSSSRDPSQDRVTSPRRPARPLCSPALVLCLCPRKSPSTEPAWRPSAASCSHLRVPGAFSLESF